MVASVALQPGALERGPRLIRVERIETLLCPDLGTKRTGEFPEAQCGSNSHDAPGHQYPAWIVQGHSNEVVAQS